jgi:hypothetical protein
MELTKSNSLTNLQRELLKVFSIELEEHQLLDVRDMLTKYFAESATREMDKLWEERGWTADTMHTWLNESERTQNKKNGAK